MIITTNNASLESANMSSRSRAALTKSLARLASSALLEPSDAETEDFPRPSRFTDLINRHRAASAGVQYAIQFSQTQDQLLQRAQSSLDRMSELASVARETKPEPNPSGGEAEFTWLQSYVSDIAGKKLNGVRLFDSTAPLLSTPLGPVPLSLKAINLAGATSTAVRNDSSGISISTSIAAESALSQIEIAVQSLANLRAQVGANLQKLSLTGEQLSILQDNLSAAHGTDASAKVSFLGAGFTRPNPPVQTSAMGIADDTHSASSGVSVFAHKLAIEWEKPSSAKRPAPSRVPFAPKCETTIHPLLTASKTTGLPKACINFPGAFGMEAA